MRPRRLSGRPWSELQTLRVLITARRIRLICIRRRSVGVAIRAAPDRAFCALALGPAWRVVLCVSLRRSVGYYDGAPDQASAAQVVDGLVDVAERVPAGAQLYLAYGGQPDQLLQCVPTRLPTMLSSFATIVVVRTLI